MPWRSWSLIKTGQWQIAGILLLMAGCGDSTAQPVTATATAHAAAPKNATMTAAPVSNQSPKSVEPAESEPAQKPVPPPTAVEEATGERATDDVPPPAESPTTDATGGDPHLVALQKLEATIDYGVGDRVIDIDLDGKTVTDADLSHLASFEDLKILNLSNTQITDAGLASLTGLKKLKFLYLFNTAITDAGMTSLTELPRLEVLCLDGTHITDIGLKTLEQLPRLEKLHVHSKGPVTDSGLESLATHVRLFELKVGGPNITPEGVKTLKEALPNCEVIYDPAAEAKEE